MSDYNDRISADEQVAAEESIARLIFDFSPEGEGYARPHEGHCAELGRQILAHVLGQFRTDLLARQADDLPLVCSQCGATSEDDEDFGENITTFWHADLGIPTQMVEAAICNNCGHWCAIEEFYRKEEK